MSEKIEIKKYVISIDKKIFLIYNSRKDKGVINILKICNIINNLDNKNLVIFEKMRLICKKMQAKSCFCV